MRPIRAKVLAALTLVGSFWLFQFMAAPAAVAPEQNDYGMEVIRLTNVERAKADLPPLAFNIELLAVAQLRAEESARKFSHTRPNGQPWNTAFTEFNIVGHRGENLAYGQRTPQRVVAAWMASTGHRANIMNPRYDLLAVGVHYKGSTIYWAQAFLGDSTLTATVFEEDEPQAYAPAAGAVYATVTGSSELNLRAQGNARARILAVMPSGTVVEVLESAEGWARVRLQNGTEGWCSERYLTM